MRGRILILLLGAVALGAGVLMYYLQVYAFYERSAQPEPAAISLISAEGPLLLDVRDYQAINAESSPIRYRACFTAKLPPAEAALLPPENPTPLKTPHWFSCFDPEAVAQGLAEGHLTAYLATPPRYGVDRIIALSADGTAYSWTQVNPCGAALYAGHDLPASCPPPPQD